MEQGERREGRQQKEEVQLLREGPQRGEEGPLKKEEAVVMMAVGRKPP